MTQRRRVTTDMAVDVPEGERNGVRVDRFEVPEELNLRRLVHALEGRDVPPGTYTRLSRDDVLWMTDTPAERRDHLEAALQIDRRGGRVLLGGLGLGMILRVALLTPTVREVDVVELDPDVAALVGPHYLRMAEERGVELRIHVDDVFAVRWPRGTRWDVAYFDVWPTLCEDNLAEMAPLRRSYGQRADWCDCWGRVWLLAHRRAW